MKLKGNLLNNLKKLRFRSERGIFRPAIIKAMARTIQIATPMTPIDTGHLRRSARTFLVSSSRSGAKGLIMYLADYAWAVHQSTKVNFRVGGPFFLKKAVAETATYVEKILKQQLEKTRKNL